MAHIHWLGAGLSAAPGIRRLVRAGRALTLWNRTVSKAKAALDGLGDNASAKPLDWDALSAATDRGDVLVSMLPATMHMQVAALCLENGAHFVSSSYVSPQMQALSDEARSEGVTLLNEVGLDPGIDHLMAHALIHDYQASDQFDTSNQHYFRSYCGGLSKVPNEFRYKFSWSPLGVLKALKSRASWIDDGQTQTTDRPWQVINEYTLSLPNGAETFEAYPNRDSRPFRQEYGLGPTWNVQEFVRGTLRLQGWSDAWSDIFALVDSAEGAQLDDVLERKSAELWDAYRLADGDPDRVVLSVELEARNSGKAVWHQLYVMDEVGDDRGSAMSRLVSIPVSLGVESVIDGHFSPGVCGAPSDPQTIATWFNELRASGEQIHHTILAP